MIEEGADKETEGRFISPPQILMHGSDVEHELSIACSSVVTKVEAFMGQGSGWVLDRITAIKISFAEFKLLRGSRYIPTSKHLANNKVIINVKNTKDNKCFLYSVAAHTHPIDRNNHANMPRHYKDEIKKFDTDGLHFPLPIDEISLFEKKNPKISVNVIYEYGVGDEGQCEKAKKPLKVTETRAVNIYWLRYTVQKTKQPFIK